MNSTCKLASAGIMTVGLTAFGLLGATAAHASVESVVSFSSLASSASDAELSDARSKSVRMHAPTGSRSRRRSRGA